MSAQCVVEYAPFMLADGASEQALLTASRRVEDEVLSKLPGYRGRILVRKSERAWADLVFWQDQEAAERAVKLAAESSICADYFGLMDMTAGAGITHFTVVQSYGGVRF
jgi:hypothetical protein